MEGAYEFYVSPDGETRAVCNGIDYPLARCQEAVDIIDNMTTRMFGLARAACWREAMKNNPQATAGELRVLAVDRFVRCNFGMRDCTADLSGNGLELEEVCCPIRGICRYQGVICMPKCTMLSTEQTRHVTMLIQGESVKSIACVTKKSIKTVRNSISRLKKKLGIIHDVQLIKIFKGFHLERRMKYETM